MIARLKGEIAEKTPSSMILFTAGVGFDILISGRTFERLPDTGKTVELDIYTHVREDEIRLVGFFNREEKEMFLKLLSVSGISIKIALSALTIYNYPELKRIITARDADMVRRVPGIGKKLAERMIVELKDRFDEEDIMAGAFRGSLLNDDKILEVRQALKSLGYNSGEINKALSRLEPANIRDMKVEEILKSALKEV